MTHPIVHYRPVIRRVSQFFKNNPRTDMSKPPRDLPPFTVVLNNFRKAIIRDIKGGRKRVPLDVYLERIVLELGKKGFYIVQLDEIEPTGDRMSRLEMSLIESPIKISRAAEENGEYFYRQILIVLQELKEGRNIQDDI